MYDSLTLTSLTAINSHDHPGFIVEASYGHQEKEVHGNECHHQKEVEEQFDFKQKTQAPCLKPTSTAS